YNQLYGNSVSNLKLSGGANDGLANPVLSAAFASRVTHVTGSFDNLNLPNATFTLDFYSAHVTQFPALSEARTHVRAATGATDAMLTFAWTVTKNGQPFATGDTASYAFTPDENGNYGVTLTVNDGVGNVNTFPFSTIHVFNVAPTVQIDSPPQTAPGASPIH